MVKKQEMGGGEVEEGGKEVLEEFESGSLDFPKLARVARRETELNLLHVWKHAMFQRQLPFHHFIPLQTTPAAPLISRMAED